MVYFSHKIRQFTRYRLWKRKKQQESEDLNLLISSTHELKAILDNLPENITYVSIILDDEDNLVLIRCHKLHEPIVVNLANINNCKLLDELRNILAASDGVIASREKADEHQTKKIWMERRALDQKFQKLIEQLQEKWLGAWAALLLPLKSGYGDDPGENGQRSPKEGIKKQIHRFLDVGYTHKSAITLARLIEWFDISDINEEKKNDWYQLMEAFKGLDGIKSKSICENIWKRWVQLYNYVPCVETRKTLKNYTLISVPPSLNMVPWESMPILWKSSALVTRIPSIHMFSYLLGGTNLIPRQVDAKKSFYVLNPGGDLTRTEETLSAILERFQWAGIKGEVPTKEMVIEAFSNYDLFLYMGHGSGGRYFGRSAIIENDCRAVSILMGCSSVKINDEGHGFDGRSVVYEYLASQSPCVIGCLWMVTDGDIDRFFIRLAEYCFAKVKEKREQQMATELLPPQTPVMSNKQPSQKKLTSSAPVSKRQPLRAHQKENARIRAEQKKAPTEIKSQLMEKSAKMDTFKLIIEGLVEARKACKLPYLTGASVVSNGLPIASLLTDYNSPKKQ